MPLSWWRSCRGEPSCGCGRDNVAGPHPLVRSRKTTRRTAGASPTPAGRVHGPKGTVGWSAPVWARPLMTAQNWKKPGRTFLDRASHSYRGRRRNAAGDLRLSQSRTTFLRPPSVIPCLSWGSSTSATQAEAISPRLDLPRDVSHSRTLTRDLVAPAVHASAVQEGRERHARDAPQF